MLLFLAVPGLALAQSAASALTLPATGTFAGGGVFRGTIAVNRFESQGGDIVAVGFVSGVLSRGDRPLGTAVAGEVAWRVTVRSGGVSLAGVRNQLEPRSAATAGVLPVSTLIGSQAAACQVLNVALSANNVNLLGAQVALSPVAVDLSGVQGMPVGDLICGASDLLGNVAGLVNLLNSLLGVLTGALGGITGGVAGAVPATMIAGMA
jgi:hypothetical protein